MLTLSETERTHRLGEPNLMSCSSAIINPMGPDAFCRRMRRRVRQKPNNPMGNPSGSVDVGVANRLIKTSSTRYAE